MGEEFAMSEKPNIALVTSLVWLVLAAGMILTAMRGGPLALTADNAMQLAQTRDLLAGQSWFDTTQLRMNAPYGLPMHWSHLLDAALAASIFHFGEYTIEETKRVMAQRGIPVAVGGDGRSRLTACVAGAVGRVVRCVHALP